MSGSDELRASRARLATAGQLERRHIERALHDDVLQTLIALSVRLQLLRGLVPDESSEAVELVAELQGETRDALDRLRALASGIYPSVLDARGLPDALREAARGTGVNARIDAPSPRRHPLDVEAALYFCCRSILDGVARDSVVSIRLRETDDAVSVELDGVADADLVAARDVIEAAGGSLTVDAAPDGASAIVVVLPLR